MPQLLQLVSDGARDTDCVVGIFLHLIVDLACNAASGSSSFTRSTDCFEVVPIDHLLILRARQPWVYKFALRGHFLRP